MKINEVKLKKRDNDSHKGSYGTVLVLAGSKGMAGAALMCGKSALKSGAGMVKFCVPDEIVDILQVGLPEATCISRDLETLNFHDYEAIALGPGLGINKSNIGIIKKILNEYTGKLVLDADGLNCIMKYTLYGNLSQTNAEVIITPHVGEAQRLLEVDQIEDRLEAAKEMAKIFGITVVMKGAGSIVVRGDDVYINNTGNPGMATGGAGDSLTGIIAALLAQGYDTYEAAKLGVFLHGHAGDICATEIGQIGMTAMDIVDCIPRVFKLLSNNY
ncbi:MAG: NAD(P)H-hydrate dehydratase [Anaerovoracaceae bacterium]